MRPTTHLPKKQYWGEITAALCAQQNGMHTQCVYSLARNRVTGLTTPADITGRENGRERNFGYKHGLEGRVLITPSTRL